MKFFSRKSDEGKPLLFLHGEDSAIAHVTEHAERNVFDEWVAESQRLQGERSAQFMGVSIRGSRLKLAAIVFLSVILLFVGKAAHLQIMSGEEYRAIAEGNRVRIDMIPSLRGVIYDRNLRVLAENAPSFRLTAIHEDLPLKDERMALFERLSSATGTPVAEILSHAADGEEHPKEPIVLIESLDYETALRLMVDAEQYPGVEVEASTERSYVTTEIPTLSHLLGYTGRISQEEYASLRETGYRYIDDLGKSGVEKTYEAELRGTFGRAAVEVDSLGVEMNIIAKEDAENGANLVLSIDANLQSKIEQILTEAIGPAGRAAVVMVDPNNGEVLALVSTPSFDSNDFAQGIDEATYRALLDDPNHPMFNRTTSAELPSGSTFKPIVAAAALAEGLIDRNTSFISVGGLQVGPYFFKDWKAGGHGVTNVSRALAESINTFFYYIGGGYDSFVGLGVEKIISYAERFGLGAPLGIDLPGEASGFLPNKRWKEEVKGERWYVGDTYNLSIGQGDLLVTPLQIAMMTSVFANGGTLYKPHLVHAFTGEGEERLKEVEVIDEQVVPEDAVTIVRQGMRQTVVSGSARSLSTLPVTAAGKTGTAQWSNTKPTHAWFTGFAPYESPEVAITVFVEEGGGGDMVAAPIARQILQWWFTQYNIAPPAVDKPLDEPEVGG